MDFDEDWADTMSPLATYNFDGLVQDDGAGVLDKGLTPTTRSQPVEPLWSPDNPLFWVGILLLAATGFIYASTTLKFGPIKGSVSV